MPSCFRELNKCSDYEQSKPIQIYPFGNFFEFYTTEIQHLEKAGAGFFVF